MLFSVFSDLLSLIDDNISVDGGNGGNGGGQSNNGQRTVSMNRNSKKKSSRSVLNEMKKMDLMSILINSLSGSWTITQMIEAIRHYEQDLQRLPERIENEKELMKEIPICYRCVQPCLAENIHYVCSHCYEIILCEQCEQRSEELHPFDFIKIKPKSLDSNSTSSTTVNPIVKAAKPAIEMFRKNFLLLLGELLRDLTIAEDCYEQYTPGTRFTKIWHIGNNGNFDWPNGTVLRCLGSNIDPINGQKSIPLSLKAGEKFDVQMDFMIPNDVNDEKIFYSVWRFWHDNHYFGQTIQMRIKAVPKIEQIEKIGEKIIVTNISDDDDVIENEKSENVHDDDDEKKEIIFTTEMVPYPDCFNLAIPFVKNGDDNNNDTTATINVIETSECDEKQSEKLIRRPEPETEQRKTEKEKEKSINRKSKSSSLKNGSKERESTILNIVRSSKHLDHSKKDERSSSSSINKMMDIQQQSKSLREHFHQFQFPATSAMLDIANRMMEKHQQHHHHHHHNNHNHHHQIKSTSSLSATATTNDNRQSSSTGIAKTIKIRRRHLGHHHSKQ